MRKILLLAPLALLGGCLSMRDATVSLVYTPASLAETPFDLRPGSFIRTIPAGAQPNQYETTGYTFNKQISLSEPIADYLKTAMVQEMRRTGASLRDTPACTIDATLNAMGLKMSGMSKLMFSSDVRYKLSAEGGATAEVPVTASVVTDTKTAEAGHSQFITKTIDGLLTDPRFVAFAKANCPRKTG